MTENLNANHPDFQVIVVNKTGELIRMFRFVSGAPDSNKKGGKIPPFIQYYINISCKFPFWLTGVYSAKVKFLSWGLPPPEQA